MEYTYREGILSLRKSGGGAIILISSPSTFFDVVGMRNAPDNRDHRDMIAGMMYNTIKGAIDTLGRNGTGYMKENIRVYTISPGVFQTEGLEKTKAAIKMNDEMIAKFNPFFKESVGNPKDLGRVMLSMFDNSTKYQPGSLVVCDHDATIDGDYWYKRIYDLNATHENYTPPKELIKDFQGNPYPWNK